MKYVDRVGVKGSSNKDKEGVSRGKDGSSSNLLKDAPTLKSILRKPVRNVAAKVGVSTSDVTKVPVSSGVTEGVSSMAGVSGNVDVHESYPTEDSFRCMVAADKDNVTAELHSNVVNSGLQDVETHLNVLDEGNGKGPAGENVSMQTTKTTKDNAPHSDPNPLNGVNVSMDSDKSNTFEANVSSAPKTVSKTISFADMVKESSGKKEVKVSELVNNEYKPVVNDDGFTTVHRGNGKGKQTGPRHVDGVKFQKPKVSFYYRPVRTHADGASTSQVNAGTSKALSDPKPNVPNDQVVDKGKTPQMAPNVSRNDASKDQPVKEGNGNKRYFNDNIDLVSLRNTYDVLQNDVYGVNDDNLSADQEGSKLAVSSCIIAHGYKGDAIPTKKEVNGIRNDCFYLVMLVAVDVLCSGFYNWVGSSTGFGSIGVRVGWDGTGGGCMIYCMAGLLWSNLNLHKVYVRNRPWCLLGDFNSALNLEDTLVGASTIDIAMREFRECVDEIEMFDVNHSGLQFTWNQKPRGLDGTLKKIDRIMSNLGFSDLFLGAHAIFQPYRISDHSPAILTIPTSIAFKPRPFKFSNIIVQNSQFKSRVKECWDTNISGFYMYRVVRKLKLLKKPMRKLLHNEGNIHDRVIKLRHELDVVQYCLHRSLCITII
ncbi:RNA-directed DNA polymerase, eukaryota, Reverse transcriptase zinc-binding domain protein [Artemisia annua]|uniref:RNA-directed DNA polymerase, eukaryota, Reverse transcriptase zinc-binding domain protein n=1 Tax=Artemisia annua TaxID=35608 RepID=A0A2U1N033_ARTAN|nr:RNA-directed DNA polymerase, eukaryota, Reverse transcriptase zinc-binding domain protein [Artemisia annua]